MVSIIFQHLQFEGLVLPLFMTDCYGNGIKYMPNDHLTGCDNFRALNGYHINTKPNVAT